MASARRDDVGILHANTIQNSQRIQDIKRGGKLIKRSFVSSTLRTGKKKNGTPASGNIYKKEYGFRKTYTSRKCTII